MCGCTCWSCSSDWLAVGLVSPETCALMLLDPSGSLTRYTVLFTASCIKFHGSRNISRLSYILSIRWIDRWHLRFRQCFELPNAYNLFLFLKFFSGGHWYPCFGLLAMSQSGSPQLFALLPTCEWLYRLTHGETPADFLTVSMATNPVTWILFQTGVVFVFHQLSSNMVTQLTNELCCTKHSWNVCKHKNAFQ